VLFSPLNPRLLYFATNTLWSTVNGGTSWSRISPDLTRTDSIVPASVGKYRDERGAVARHPGVIYTVAPSPVSAGTIWAGSDDGLIHVTNDRGRSWKNVTPEGLAPWSKISVMDASHFEVPTAYAAVNTLRLDDLNPHIYRTRDGGKSWVHITEGIPPGATVNAVREDPVRKGLLFAAGETQVWVSFDDGDHWQSLRLNMPASSIRDVAIKDNDLLAGTHGRGFWILDDISVLRQADAGTESQTAWLARPARATRVRGNTNTDTPLPPDDPAAANPPDGAILSYWLGAAAAGPVRLEIHDDAGALVRTFSSEDPPDVPIPGRNIPDYWIRPPQVLSSAPGMHRFVWNLREADPVGVEFGYPIAAVPMNTVKEPGGPWVLPGNYAVTLVVNGKRYNQPLSVRMDPRVKTPALALVRQHALSVRMVQGLKKVTAALEELRALRAKVKAAQTGASGAAATALAQFDGKAAALEGSAGGAHSLGRLGGELAGLYGTLQEADVAPTTQTLAAIAERDATLREVLARWAALRGTELAALDATLRAAGMEEIH
jgi:hypothetical protein